jgi:hypothetical protein
MVSEPVFRPDPRVQRDTIHVLSAYDAELSPGLQRHRHEVHMKNPTTGWARADQVLKWQVVSGCAESFEARVLVAHKAGSAVRLQIEGPRGAVSAVQPALPGSPNPWRRVALDGRLELAEGANTLALSATSLDGGAFELEAFAVELVRSEVRERLHRQAAAMISDMAWLRQAGYGFMNHWTQAIYPERGPRLPYDQAVQNFDASRYADQAARGGAGFVVLTTTHGPHYFPAPLAALDAILPGRAAKRDLVADLIDALGRRGIRLFLYYHLGAQADPEWLAASGFFDTDTSTLFGNWQRMIREAGERYGEGLAGWWFDDGAVNYYYRTAPWPELSRAAKAGSPARLIGYNSWFQPPVTEFQDFHCGEIIEDPSYGGTLAAGGDGRYTGGTYQGMNAVSTIITERYWDHTRPDEPISLARWSSEELAALIGEFRRYRCVPIFNLEIYQDGRMSEDTIERFAAARRRLGPSPWKLQEDGPSAQAGG